MTYWRASSFPNGSVGNRVFDPRLKHSRMTVRVGILFFLLTCLSGCIRLTGTAAYWKKNADDEAPQGKSVTLDSDDLVYPARAKGSITT